MTTRSPAELAAHRQQFVQEVMAGRAALGRCVVQRIINEQDQARAASAPEPTFDVLILSGGGDYGAFGAGVLNGWGSVTDPQFRRPIFDVVTGVSTGALIAPFAFVGTDAAYEQAFSAYRKPNPQWFKLRRILSIALLRESFFDNTGLRNEIHTRMDDSMIHAIADARDQNRLLLIGTTNLDLGMLTMWDATRLAREAVAGTRDRSTFDDVILASTAIPAVFPPVKIEGDLYVDGGVTRNIAYTTDQEFADSAVNIWKKEHPLRKPPKWRVWVIVNKQLGTAPEHLLPTWPAVMERSLDLAIRASTITSLKGLALAIQYLHLRDGIDIELRIIAIPDEWRPPVKGPFKKETMNSLAELGCKLGADPTAWRTSVPNPESPEN
jgi:predicted patatin/cPLA2 family phospholipase